MYIWKVSKYRRDKRTGAINPVKASKYYLELSKEVGWNEETADRELGGQTNYGIRNWTQTAKTDEKEVKS
ncbi:hypothetical protein [Virgibacillus dokdonensis]|uniref:hypothetical protein n=1 Tax=Virgibacillus dokdonensis TaxID=302167 RepID=UPI0015F261D3|nr:hypothetical protein [Virgibacillus dokdonensis]